MSSTDAGRLIVEEPAPGLAQLTISNPGRRGALDHAILDSFATTLPRLDARCVLITGEERIFSAGYDIGDLPDSVFADEAEKLVAHPFAAAIDAIDAYPYPTLAVLNGHAIGGGLELALSCDLRVACGAVKLGMPPAKLGLIYSHTGIRKFIDAIGAARTRELFLLGRQIDARVALAWGLVNEVCEPDQLAERSLALARELAENAPLAQLGNKRIIRAVLDARAALDPDLERELIELRRSCFSSDDFREGVRAFAEKRPPDWKGRWGRPGVRPPAYLAGPMPPLITPEEALRLGELEDHAEIEALVERAWRVRVERFADATDMCSLVNAKSGGCAEDCGFCAQSRYAEADTPMHAMMDPEQILEHALAAQEAGAHRFCMVTQGQGLSKRDFQKVLAGARLVAEHTNLKRCVSIGHMSAERAKALKEAGIQRVHHNVETAESYYPEVSATVRYEGRLRTIEAVREAGLETCVGGILNLGETREQRVEMAFELSEIDPTSVPINLLNPRPGTKFGDRELMDPWEVVKWIAIFRLILPDALFRLCGGRVENLGELQATAVKAGLNGVMMGNFLTTLGNTPDEDRTMFEEAGLNVGRQADNGSNPRPDNRSGWLEGEPPDLVEVALEAAPISMQGAELNVRLWDPATQLRFHRKPRRKAA